jgi:hypothetical protein
MPSQPREFRVQRGPGIRDHLAAHDHQLPASGYRLMQAEALMSEMNYVRQDDGSWRLPDDG